MNAAAEKMVSIVDRLKNVLSTQRLEDHHYRISICISPNRTLGVEAVKCTEIVKLEYQNPDTYEPLFKAAGMADLGYKLWLKHADVKVQDDQKPYVDIVVQPC